MKDPFLLKLVNIVHSNEFTFDITLTTTGGTVTGTLISTKEYFDRFSQAFSNALPGGPNEAIRSSLSAWGERRGASLDAVEDGDDPFIHLKNARFIDGAGAVPAGNQGIMWRGKLADVVGFTLGAG
ncbi:hypothetical protein D3C77_551600 [compost metagenome]